MILIGKEDLYGGVTVKTTSLAADVKCSEKFEDCLKNSLSEWTSTGKRGLWFYVDLKDSHLIPILTRNSFVFHHAQEQYVALTRWIPDTICTLPKYPHMNIGVGGVVYDNDGRILMMKEQKGIYLGWKFPGGLADPVESIYEAGAREVLEETGVRAVAETTLLFRETSRSQFEGVGDIYFVLGMRLEDQSKTEIKACPHETAAAKWFTRQEILDLPAGEIHKFHHVILEEFDNWIKSSKKGLNQVQLDHPSGYPVKLHTVCR